MQDSLKHKAQCVVRVISEMLCETKKVAEQCPVGTINDDARLDPKYGERQLLRRMFRSVWDTAYSTISHLNVFIEDPVQASLRSTFVIQRDLIDKIVDIPFVIQTNKAEEYLDYFRYVSGPQKAFQSLHTRMDNSQSFEGSGDLEIVAAVSNLLTALMTDLDTQINEKQRRGMDVGDELSVLLSIGKVLFDWKENSTTLERKILDARKNHEAESILPEVNQWMLKWAKSLLDDVENLLTASFVTRYHGRDDWMELSSNERQKFRKNLAPWKRPKHAAKLAKGILHYINEGFYGSSISKNSVEALPSQYYRLSQFVHDEIWDSTHSSQSWVEPNDDSVVSSTLDIILDTCATAIYVAAAHYYDSSQIGEKTKILEGIITENNGIWGS